MSLMELTFEKKKKKKLTCAFKRVSMILAEKSVVFYFIWVKQEAAKKINKRIGHLSFI